MAKLIKVAETKDLPPGSAAAFEVEGQSIALFNVAGTFYAIDDTCPHSGGPLSQGQVDGAIDQFQTAVRLEPRNWRLHQNLGQALLRKERVRDAVSHFEKALQLKPGDPALQSDLKMARDRLNH